MATTHYNLYVTDSTTETFKNFREQLASGTNSNMTKIDEALYSHVQSAAYGGTGKTGVTAGNYLVGNGNGAMTEKTPAQVRENIEACKVTQYSATFDKDDWLLNATTSYYEQTLTVTGLKATYSAAPIVDCVLSGTNTTTDSEILDGFSCIDIVETGTNSLTARCIAEVPNVDVPVRVVVFA